ncbi:hypothetical protein F5B22DRAFT_575026 [Xylaria bambusicola]|uniref:uncharacterized protein n=1 Tax=Xylaria bambusicola TaxID=326684 RepID=UPI0020089F89|nr:uncharacterized protein F5B22DRAFT_575026 [Xylaria bambusicola]KAI0503114.1 hypothetical protein F5B22DRAFT_575026 [Xylaria bambusicola]
MAPIRRHRIDRSKSPATGPYTRSRSSLQGAPAAQTRLQLSSSRKQPSGKDEVAGISKPRPVTCHTSYPHHVQQVAIPQRSSLRHALRESQKLFDENPSIPISVTPDSAPPNLPVPGQMPKHSAQSASKDISTGSATTHLSGPPHVPALRLNPQRSSLRRAICESLKAFASGDGESGPSTHLPKLDLARSSAPSPESIEKRQPRRHTWLPSRFQRMTELTPTLPQRSSLRRAIRESLRATIQGSDPVDLTPAVVISAEDFALKDTVEAPLPRSEVQGGSIVSTPDSPESTLNAPLTPTKNVGAAELVPEISCTPSTSSAKPSLAPHTPAPRELVTVLRPRKKLVSESRSMTDARSSPTPSNSLSCLGTTTTLCNDVNSIAENQIPDQHSSDQSALENGEVGREKSGSEASSTRKGWHQICEIINEVPSGLYLVEWEGRDPRTGVKWPASWVCISHTSPIIPAL